MTNQEIAATLQDRLGLERPPVGMEFRIDGPDGVPAVGRDLPSGCSYWRRAEDELFYAPAEAHFNCPVGSYVLGFDLPEAQQQELMGLVETMAGVEYFDPAEAAHLPRVPGEKRGVLYGPLSAFPTRPDLVLCWFSPAQAMLAAEAVGTSVWSGESGMKSLGRPACAALPVALDRGEATLSLGCAGMRVYTGVARGEMLCALPLAQAEKLAAELPRVTAANEAIVAFHEARRAAVACTE